MFLVIYFVCMYVCAMVHMWRSKDTLQELSLSFYHVGAGDQNQVTRFVSLITEPLVSGFLLGSCYFLSFFFIKFILGLM